MNGNVIPMPYPHAFNDCCVCGQYDADMQAIHPGVGERPAAGAAAAPATN
jgi:hypothetical protein